MANHRRLGHPIKALAFLLMLCTVAAAQTPEKRKEQTTKVYVWVAKSDKGEVLPANYGELISFTQTLLRMQVKAFERFEAEPVEKEPVCGASQPPRQDQQRSEAIDTPVEKSPSYYLIRVEIYSLQKTADSELVLDYEISRYDQCSRQLLIHRTAPFREATALERIADLTTSIRAVLELGTSAQHSKKVIDIHQALGGVGNEAQEVRTGITDVVLLSLRAENDLDPRDRRKEGASTPPADYEIKPMLINQRRLSARLNVSFKKDGKEQSYQSKEVLGPMLEKPSDANKKAYQDKLATFYEDVAKTAFSFLNDVRFAVEAGIATNQLSTADVALLTKTARDLMCDLPDSASGCEPQYERALPLLKESAGKIKDPHLFFLLAQAQSKDEDFVRAAQAFDEGWRMIGKAKSEALPYVINAANSWYRVPNFEWAAERYDSAIKLADSAGKSQYEHHLQRIRSYHFAGERLKALTALIDTLSKFPEKKEGDLEDELKSLVDDFIGWDELTEAARIIRDNESVLPGHSVIKLIYSLLADALLDSVESEYHKAKASPSAFEAMEARLTRLYGKSDSLFPVARSGGSSIDLSDEQKAQVFYLRALILRDNPKARSLDEAATLLNRAIDLDTNQKNQFRYELAVTQNERALASAGADPKEAYAKAIGLLEKLLKDADLRQQSYLLLREINHKRNDDEATATSLKKLLEESKTDQERAAFSRTLLGFCIDYLADFKCAKDTAHSLDKLLEGDSKLRDDIALGLDVAEAYVLSGTYDKAERRLNQVPGSRSHSYLPVLRFYQYWYSLAANAPDALKSLESWEKAFTSVKNNGERVPWRFDGALKFLGTESGNPFNSEQKTKLKQMINAMRPPAAR